MDVVGSYVQLNKRSGANLFGLCPFHSEKTPSFSVNQEKQIYHCFGCGKGGSVFNFIMAIENLSFPDAVAFLARRAGMNLPEEDGADREKRNRRERMLAMNRAAARWFHSQLLSPGGKTGQDYVLRRGISPAMVTAFGLGFAPDSFYSLTDALKQQGYEDFELIDGGLANANRNGKGVHDVFRNRLMFPVIDVRGNVIGFSGRILGDGEPKYLNTRESLVFNKSRNLFALNLAKKSKSGYLLLSEGNIDVVSLHQAGFDSAVASLGTSLTPEQARLMSQYTKEIIIAYDNDGAGQKAAQRAIGILEKLDLKVRVLRMSGAKDPDEFIQSKGTEAFRKLIEDSENHIEYRLGALERNYDLSQADQKVAYLQDCAAVIAELPSPVEREVYAMRVGEKTGVNKAVVADEVERARKRQFYSARKQAEKGAVRELRASVQPKERSLRYENERSAMAEEGVVRLMYLDPELLRGTDLRAEEFSSPMLGRLFELLRERDAAGASVTMPTLSGSFTQEEMDHITYVLQKPETLANAKRALADYINVIRTERSASGPGDALTNLLEQKRKQEKR